MELHFGREERRGGGPLRPSRFYDQSGHDHFGHRRRSWCARDQEGSYSIHVGGIRQGNVRSVLRGLPRHSGQGRRRRRQRAQEEARGPYPAFSQERRHVPRSAGHGYITGEETVAAHGNRDMPI